MAGESRFYLVEEDILPESILKTVQAKEMLLRGEVSTVNEAVGKVKLSRSAYYKYKDKVFSLYHWGRGRTITLNILMEHRSGVLSSVLGTIASMQGNLLTINQDLPSQGLASASLSIDTANIKGNLEELINRLSKLDGVRRALVLGDYLVG